MICTLCNGPCGYKNNTPCEHCTHESKGLTGICKTCVDEDCQFKEADERGGKK